MQRQMEKEFGWMFWPTGLSLGPSRQATADENAACLLCALLDHPGWTTCSAESFVGIHGSFRNQRTYAGLRGFFLPANARSRLRR